MKLLNDLFPYKFNKAYMQPAAYFSMEYAIDQPLKIYSGGLGFLAGSHMRSAYELKQNMIGIGILWKHGYYDQTRNTDGTMKSDYQQKNYSFLTDVDISFPITVNGASVKVKALLLKPDVFKTAPLFLLTTDIPENDYLSKTICHRLYDPNEKTRIAQSILLGAGGAQLLDILGRDTEIYHMNEGHALPLGFYLLNKYKSADEVKRRMVFTTHTPERAGNEEHALHKLEEMDFFQGVPDELKQPFTSNHSLNYTLTALRMAKRANAVSQLHHTVTEKMWAAHDDTCDIIAITNTQNKKYWLDNGLEQAYQAEDTKALAARKLELKETLFRKVADQTGKLFSEKVFTLVWARRFAAYKRADLLLLDFDRFTKRVKNSQAPIQIIWAGKPYPEDHTAIELFNEIYLKTQPFANCAVLTGYELELSALLKRGSDGWLNTPKIFREASGTSGMSAAMNASVNISIADGWVPEFAKHAKNCFLIPHATPSLLEAERNRIECENLYETLENEVLPMYYKQPAKWRKIIYQGMNDVLSNFDSNRMAREYYKKLYL